MANLSGPTHLFISYASEDSSLAAWLARKLTALGYAVWIDQIKMLGGEPWPQTIDDAIKNRTFRVLALISKNSISKPKPTKERTLAQRLSEQRAIPDFLIPLKIDGTELDWMTTDLSYIPFTLGWAEGLRRVEEKLNSISAPKTLNNGPWIAKASLGTWRELISENTEQLLSNVMRVKNIPSALSAYRWKQGVEDAIRNRATEEWHCFLLNDGALAFDDPPEYAQEYLEKFDSKYNWVDSDSIFGNNSRVIVSKIVLRYIRSRLLEIGFLPHPKRNDTFYLPENFSDDGKLHFGGISRKQTWLKIKGKASFITLGKSRETNSHNFAVSVHLARGIDKDIWLKIAPTLFFIDGAGNPIIDERVGPRRKRLTKTWWNNKWANRLLAFEEIFLKTEHVAPGFHLDVEPFLRLDAQMGINETLLIRIKDENEDDELQDNVYVIDPDEIANKADANEQNKDI